MSEKVVEGILSQIDCDIANGDLTLEEEQELAEAILRIVPRVKRSRVKVGDIVRIPSGVVVVLSLKQVDEPPVTPYEGADYCHIEDYAGLETKAIGVFNADYHKLGSCICKHIGRVM